MDKINLLEKFSLFQEQWSPKIIAELNNQMVKLAKIQGEFVWHSHADEDELFMVVKGRFRMDYRDRQVWVEEGEIIVVPRGIEHRPFAEQEAWILLFEPAVTLHTGDVVSDRTVNNQDRI